MSFSLLLDKKINAPFLPNTNVANCNGNYDVTEYFEEGGGNRENEISPESQRLFDVYI